MYKDLKEKKDYLIKQLNKVSEKLPKFIQETVTHLFNYSGMDLKRFKEEYDPEFKKKSFIDKVKQPINVFKKKEIEKATKHINEETDKSVENFYKSKNEKKKDDGISL